MKRFLVILMVLCLLTTVSLAEPAQVKGEPVDALCEYLQELDLMKAFTTTGMLEFLAVATAINVGYLVPDFNIDMDNGLALTDDQEILDSEFAAMALNADATTLYFAYRGPGYKYWVITVTPSENYVSYEDPLLKWYGVDKFLKEKMDDTYIVLDYDNFVYALNNLSAAMAE